MKNMMKKILPLVLSVLFCLSASTTAFAAGGRTQETDVKTIVVNQDTLNLNATDVKEYAEYGKQLAAVLKGTDKQTADKVIETFCESHSNPVFERINGVIAESNRDGKGIYLKTTADFDKGFEKTFAIDDKRTLFITPTYIMLGQTIFSN